MWHEVVIKYTGIEESSTDSGGYKNNDTKIVINWMEKMKQN